ncbi:MAG: hypothetical protein OEM62_02990 [Acidobacteriota bacterium]|nr:hypothetical protein [Acidobacteriota bacterium]
MRQYLNGKSTGGRIEIKSPLRGADLLTEPMYTKGSAFSLQERATVALDGLLPEAVSTMELQAERVYENIVRKSDRLEQSIDLATA